MGLKPGERVERIGPPIRVIDVRKESLRKLVEAPLYGAQEAEKEGFPGKTGIWLANFFIFHISGATLETQVNRIEFAYTNMKTEFGPLPDLAHEILSVESIRVSAQLSGLETGWEHPETQTAFARLVALAKFHFPKT